MKPTNQMSKAELHVTRAERIDALATATTQGEREEIQADLRNVNARLKQLNIEEAQKLKAVSVQRKAAGHAVQQDNLRRAAAKLPESTQPRSESAPARLSRAWVDITKTGDSMLAAYVASNPVTAVKLSPDQKRKLSTNGREIPPVQASESPKRHLTRGEFLLKHAKQMRKAIASIKQDRRLPHTTEFLAQLDAFIVGQEQHLSASPFPGTDGFVPITTTTDWQNTWEENDK